MFGRAYWFPLSSPTKGPTVASENVHILSDETFADSIGGDEPVLVDFWAEWCGPCKMIAPILDEIADEQVGSVKIAKLNVDDAPDTARQYEVMSIPTMILFKDGQPVKKIVGAKPKDAILGELAEYL
jgi:thioredoxin 1